MNGNDDIRSELVSRFHDGPDSLLHIAAETFAALFKHAASVSAATVSQLSIEQSPPGLSRLRTVVGDIDDDSLDVTDTGAASKPAATVSADAELPLLDEPTLADKQREIVVTLVNKLFPSKAEFISRGLVQLRDELQQQYVQERAVILGSLAPQTAGKDDDDSVQATPESSVYSTGLNPVIASAAVRSSARHIASSLKKPKGVKLSTKLASIGEAEGEAEAGLSDDTRPNWRDPASIPAPHFLEETVYPGALANDLIMRLRDIRSRTREAFHEREVQLHTQADQLERVREKALERRFGPNSLTALLATAVHGNKQLALLLLDLGARADAVDLDENTWVHWIAHNVELWDRAKVADVFDRCRSVRYRRFRVNARNKVCSLPHDHVCRVRM